MGFSNPRYVGHCAFRGLALYPNGQPLEPKVSYMYGRGLRAGYVPISPTKVYWFICFNSPSPGLPIKLYLAIGFGEFCTWRSFLMIYNHAKFSATGLPVLAVIGTLCNFEWEPFKGSWLTIFSFSNRTTSWNGYDSKLHKVLIVGSCSRKPSDNHT